MSHSSSKDINQVQRRLQRIAQERPTHRGSSSDLTRDLRARLEKKQRLKVQLRRAEQDRRLILRSLQETEDDLQEARQKEEHRAAPAAAASSDKEAEVARPSSSGRENKRRSSDGKDSKGHPSRKRRVSHQSSHQNRSRSRSGSRPRKSDSSSSSKSSSSSDESSKSSSEDELEPVQTGHSGEKTVRNTTASQSTQRKQKKSVRSRSSTPPRHLSPGDRDHRRNRQQEETASLQLSPAHEQQQQRSPPQVGLDQHQPQSRPQKAWSKLYHKSDSVPNLLPDLLDPASCRQILATQTQDFEAIFLFQQLRFYRKLIRAYTDPPQGVTPTPDLHPPHSSTT